MKKYKIVVGNKPIGSWNDVSIPIGIASEDDKKIKLVLNLLINRYYVSIGRDEFDVSTKYIEEKISSKEIIEHYVEIVFNRFQEVLKKSSLGRSLGFCEDDIFTGTINGKGIDDFIDVAFVVLKRRD